MDHCLIAGNGTGCHSYYGRIDLLSCTIVGQRGAPFSQDSYPSVRGCIVWGNGSASSLYGPLVSYSDFDRNLVRPGPGTISVDPLFVDPANGDYRLRPGSPCIDTGDPDSPLDPDSSRADMGAFPFDKLSPTAWVPRPVEIALAQNTPNPFNPATTLRFALPHNGRVSLTIFDISGRLVRTLVDGRFDAGRHSAVWDGTDDAGRSVASGVYLYRLTADGRTLVRRLALLR